MRFLVRTAGLIVLSILSVPVQGGAQEVRAVQGSGRTIEAGSLPFDAASVALQSAHARTLAEPEPNVSGSIVPPPDVLPPCCHVKKKRDRKPSSETVDDLPPRLKSMEAVAEVKVPARLPAISAIAHEMLPASTATDRDSNMPVCCSDQREREHSDAIPSRFTFWEAVEEVAQKAALPALILIGFMLAIRRRRRGPEIDLRPAPIPIWTPEPAPYEPAEPGKTIVASARSRESPRALEDA